MMFLEQFSDIMKQGANIRMFFGEEKSYELMYHLASWRGMPKFRIHVFGRK